MGPKLHLLEPYYGALVSMGYDEGLVQMDDSTAKSSRSLERGRAPATREELLQLLVLFEHASIGWTDTRNAAELEPLRDYLPYKNGAGLQTAGIVELIKDEELEADANSVRAAARTRADLWKPYAQEVEALAPMIANQLTARGKAITEQLIHFFIAVRIGDIDRAWLLARMLSAADRVAAREIEQERLEGITRYDVPISTELYQCLLARKRTVEHDSTVAGPELGATTVISKVPQVNGIAAKRLISIVAEELLQHKLILPLPQNLEDAVRWRSRPAVVEFRDVFFPWLTALLNPSSGEEVRLRREIRKMLKGAKWGPRVRRVSKFVQYAGVAFEVAGLITPNLPGIGLVATGVSGGAERLAERFESRSRWLLCATGTGSDQNR